MACGPRQVRQGPARFTRIKHGGLCFWIAGHPDAGCLLGTKINSGTEPVLMVAYVTHIGGAGCGVGYYPNPTAATARLAAARAIHGWRCQLACD
jgi:hypothetical protein